MKFAWLFLALFGLIAPAARATNLPELKAIEARYDQSKLAADEPLREKYINELAVLRWRLSRNQKPGWEQVDLEIARHPAPANSDSATLTKLRTGKWQSPRHDYLYKSDGTWVMDPDDDSYPVSEHTHGVWAIKGNQYMEEFELTSSTIILLDKKTFIYVDSQGDVFYERHHVKSGLPLRRDDPAP